MTGDSRHDPWLQQARSYLRTADPVLARLIDDRPGFDPPGVDGAAPAELLVTDLGQLREAGPSWRKVSTLRDLAGRLSD